MTGDRRDPTALSDPAVPSTVYDAQYYLRSCAGAEPWVASGGQQLDPLYRGSLERARLRPGEVVVDLGTGRGELLVEALALGASLAVGVEYAEAALALARRTVQVHQAAARTLLVAADARRLPLPSACADLVTLLDIVEHLTPSELHTTLVEARRVLRPGGRVFVHTMPNRLVYDVTYRWQRRWHPGRWRRWPADPRVELERVMHVNEQSPRALRQALLYAGLVEVSVTLGALVYESFVPDAAARRTYHRLARLPVVAALGAGDLWAEGRAPAR